LNALTTLVIFAVLLTLLGRFVWRLRRAVEASEAVAVRLKLQVIRDAGLVLHAPDLQGTIGQQTVRMHTVRDPEGRRRMQVIVSARHICPAAALQVRARRGWGRLKALVSREAIPTHDPDFDALAATYGEPYLVATLLNGRARRAIADGMRAFGLEVIDGDARIVRTTPITDADDLEAMLLAVAHVGEALASTGSRSERLLETVQGDPIPAVRVHALNLLLDGPRDPSQRVAAQGALTNRSPAVRLRAASFLGVDGFEALAELVRDCVAPDAIRAKALQHLAFNAPAYIVRPLIMPALESASPEVIQAGALAASRHQHRDAFVPLCRLLGHFDAPTEASIARALGRLGDVPSQPILLKLLDNPHDEARVAAAESLGFIGDIDAVAALLPLTQGVKASGALKQTARASVEAIQGRARGAGAGHLALTDAGGDLSLIDPAPPTTPPDHRAPATKRADPPAPIDLIDLS
jgi:HEAT repeat protein